MPTIFKWNFDRIYVEYKLFINRWLLAANRQVMNVYMENVIGFFFSCLFCIRLDDGDGCVGNHDVFSLDFLVAMRRKRHNIFYNIQCNVSFVLVYFVQEQQTLATERTEIYHKIQTTDDTWMCHCQWKIMHSHFCCSGWWAWCMRHDESIDERNDPFEYLSWMSNVDTMPIAARSYVNSH